MAYLKHIETGAVTDWIDEEAAEYLTLAKIRTKENIKVKGTGGFGAGSGGEYTDVAANTPYWSAVAFEDTGWPDPTGGRAQILYCGGASGTTEELTQSQYTPPAVGKVKEAFWVPLAGIELGAANYRTINVYQWRHKEKVKTEEAPAEKVILCKLSLKSVTAAAYEPVKMTVEASAEIKGGVSSGNIEPLMVNSVNTGAGVVDPGSIVYVVYTRL